jgi:hypothetical protein
MNIVLVIKPDYAAAILAGVKTVELRSYVPRDLHAGDTIFLVSDGRMWGHCTFAGATPMPLQGVCRDRWLAAIAAPAAVPEAVARQQLGKTSAGFAWHLRYPVSYGERGLRYPSKTIPRYMYTATEPRIVHPKLANYLLYLKTHP